MRLVECKCDIKLCKRLLKFSNIMDAICPVERNITVGGIVVYCHKRVDGADYPYMEPVPRMLPFDEFMVASGYVKDDTIWQRVK